jgi:AraC family transcriptional regulator of adaptative response / DNA-3-methyladenine glycosylase II
MRSFLRARAIPGVEAVFGNRYARTVVVDDEPGILTVEPWNRNSLKATVWLKNAAGLQEATTRLRGLFDLAADPVTIGTALSVDPWLAPLVAARPGLRVPGAWDGFELAVRAILGQQITVTAASLLAGKLVAAYGERIADATPELGLTHVFPSPARFVAADLTAVGMPQARRAALRAMAAAVVAEPSLFARRASLGEAITVLRSLHGIGEWTAHYIAMRALREPDAFPAADIGLLRAMSGETGARPSPAQLLTRAERWRPWRAYAAVHLWASQSAARETGSLRSARPMAV